MRATTPGLFDATAHPCQGCQVEILPLPGFCPRCAPVPRVTLEDVQAATEACAAFWLNVSGPLDLQGWAEADARRTGLEMGLRGMGA